MTSTQIARRQRIYASCLSEASQEWSRRTGLSPDQMPWTELQAAADERMADWLDEEPEFDAERI